MSPIVVIYNQGIQKDSFFRGNFMLPLHFSIKPPLQKLPLTTGVICPLEISMDERLCKTLKPILELELSRGNVIESIDAPAGTSCSLVLNLRERIDHEAVSKLSLANTVERWENKDRHYPLQVGYGCSKYKHSIAGPL